MVVYGPTQLTNPPTLQREAGPPSGVERELEARPLASGAGEPSLWKVLTDEERLFFTQQAELGPLTYGPKGEGSSRAEAPKGQRLDVRA